MKIISGGQTGVDRGALDAAIRLGFDHGGFCPLGRKAEDGRIPDRYKLTEVPSENYRDRTLSNIHEADGTLVVIPHPNLRSPGTSLTIRMAEKHSKCLIITLNGYLPNLDVSAARAFLRTCQIRTLNVGGPRESVSPGIQQATCDLLLDVFDGWVDPPEPEPEHSIMDAFKRAAERLEDRPKLPLCVNDDQGKPWSSHLIHVDAMKHLRMARKMGVKNPTVTDGKGRDITAIVDGWINGDPVDL